MTVLVVVVASAAALLLVLLHPLRASAHCDTMDGPTALDGRAALEANNLNHALKWVAPEAEQELREVFDKSVRVRALGADAREVADRWFLENLVRLHRAGEGAPFAGLRPSGVPVDPKVAAADRCVDEGSLQPLAGLVPPDRLPELEKRLAVVLERKGYDVDDVAAGRAFVQAYVSFFKFAEGEDEGHAHHTRTGHRH
jgi:hypothetical protein